MTQIEVRQTKIIICGIDATDLTNYTIKDSHGRRFDLFSGIPIYFCRGADFPTGNILKRRHKYENLDHLIVNTAHRLHVIAFKKT